MDDPALFALLLTALAGLSTGLGSAIAFFTRRSNKGFLAASLGFSAGVMVYVSFVELFAGGQELLVAGLGAGTGEAMAVAAFFGGILLIGLIDRYVPDVGNPHEAHLVEEMGRDPDTVKLNRLGMMTALAIGIHNFPEGVATFMSALADPMVGVSIAIAIALHNIPEGISVSVPIYYATGSRKRAFWLSFLSGIAEPVGAVLAYLILRPFLTDPVLGAVYAVVAGIMVFISLDQLIPNAKKYDQGHLAVYGLIAGMLVMALTLLFL